MLTRAAGNQHTTYAMKMKTNSFVIWYSIREMFLMKLGCRLLSADDVRLSADDVRLSADDVRLSADDVRCADCRFDFRFVFVMINREMEDLVFDSTLKITATSSRLPSLLTFFFESSSSSNFPLTSSIISDNEPLLKLVSRQ